MDFTQNYNIGNNFMNPNMNPFFQMNQNFCFNQFNPMNLNMNYNNMPNAQIMNYNQMNQNINNNPIDLFPYIKEEKKIIRFINSNNDINYIKIPIFITKNELYSIASKYKALGFSKIILSYNNCLLKKDESSIDEIPEGAEINIIEERNIPSYVYYQSLIKKYGKNDIRNITLSFSTGKKMILNFPGNSTFSEVVNAINQIYGSNEENLVLLYNGQQLSTNDKRKIRDVENGDFMITIIENREFKHYFGKPIIANINIKKKNGEQIKARLYTGTLESTTSLFEDIERKILISPFKNQKLYFNDIELKREDEKSLLSLGIKKDFTLLLEL